jgi:predicted NAD/FAD-binding protein
MRIAVVGGGIAGLTAASVLHRRHEITLFEANPYVGGHTNTIDVPDEGRSVPVDTGFIVFNEINYPSLCRLFDAHDVVSQSSNMSFSVHCDRTGLEYNGTSFDTLFAQRRNVLRGTFWSMLADILRFNREAPRELERGLDDTVTVLDYLGSRNYNDSFAQHYLLPLGASLWSCDADRFSQFPIRFVIEFLHNHRMLQVNGRPQWRTVVGGSREYVKKLTKPFRDRIFTATPVSRVRRQARGVELTTTDGHSDVFDEVVLATHADQAAQMVADLDDTERQVLHFFPYQDNEVLLHTDTSVMPEVKKAWASWNYRIPEQVHGNVTVTYNMNLLQRLDSRRTYCVSLNQTARVDQRRVIRRIKYEHPLFIPGRAQAQAEHASLIRRRGVSYCGAYWGYGFHEDGVRSGLAVCDAFGMGLEQ